jgi:hypothetical protein
LSKLFDQLKKAARSRRDRSPGLLLEALQKAQETRDGPVAPASAAAPESSSAPSFAAPDRAGAPAAVSAPAAPFASRSSYSGILLALAIFLVVVAAWYSTPWRAPAKVKIDPTDLKLDRSLDLQRQPSKGTSSPVRPS